MRVHPWPIVTDAQTNVEAGGNVQVFALSRFSHLGTGGFDNDAPTVGHRLPCVDHQGDQDLLDLLWIDTHLSHFGARRDQQLAALPGEILENFAEVLDD